MSDSTLEAEITRLVRRAWDGRARVAGARPLAGDASSRSYFRLALEGAPRSTAVLMKQSGSGLSISSDELSSIPETPKEMPFLNVQRYLHRIGIAVPEVYAADSERGLALLEDIGDTTLWDATEEGPAAVLRLFQSAIDELVALQRGGEERPDEDCIAFRQRFDSRLFLWEFDHFLEYGFAGRALADRGRAELRKRFEELADELASGPQVLAHRDYHGWNLFVQDQRLRVIDFQDALLAPLPYDLATLLNDRATPTRVTPGLERALVGYFCERRSETLGGALEPKTFLSRYFRFVLQKSFKIVGRFHYLENVKGKRGYLAMLPHTFATVRRCFENLPDLGDLRALLVKSFPELA